MRRAFAITLMIAGIGMLCVSIWLLADSKVKLSDIIVLDFNQTHSPKVGVATGILVVLLGSICFFMVAVEQRKRVLQALIGIAIVLSITTFGLAVKEYLDFKKAEDFQQKHLGGAGNFGRQNSFGQRGSFQNIQAPTLGPEIWTKFKTQYIVLSVAAGIGVIFEIAALVMATKMRRTQSTRNNIQLERSF